MDHVRRYGPGGSREDKGIVEMLEATRKDGAVRLASWLRDHALGDPGMAGLHQEASDEDESEEDDEDDEGGEEEKEVNAEQDGEIRED